jgi:hypothetical protein
MTSYPIIFGIINMPQSLKWLSGGEKVITGIIKLFREKLVSQNSNPT